MPGIGVGIGVGFNSGSSWQSYWTSRTDVLFFGEASKISGGKLYNQVSGSSDFLTVTGSAGSYTFQCPNTASYIATDQTDRLWTKTDDSLRTVLESDLIGFDFTKTFTKYSNAAPHTLNVIIIFKSTASLTDDDKNRLSREFSLWEFAFGVFNENGYLKENRPGAAWAAESGFEAETITFLAVIPEQTNARKIAINNLIKYYKDNGVWVVSDAIVILRGAANSILFDLKRNHDPELVGSPTVTPDVGVSTTTNKYIRTHFIPSTNGVNYVQNAAGIGVKLSSYDNTGGTTRALMGSSAETTPHDVLIAQTAGSLHRINDAATVLSGGGIPIPANGYNNLTRTNSTKCYFYRNGTKYSPSDSTSGGVPTKELYVGCSNVNGTPNYFVTATQEFYIITGAMTDAIDLAIRTGFDAYIAAL